MTGEVLDTIAKLLGKYGSWLNINKHRSSFLIWMLCCFYWFYIDLQRELYSQAAFVIPTLCMHAYGYYKWRDNEKDGQDL